MQVIETGLQGLVVLEPRVFGDPRGYFFETYQRQRYLDAGVPDQWVQDNTSRSARGILRGLHYQIGQPQGKLVWVTRGAVYDVAVDLRRSSPTFGRWYGTELSDENHRQMYLPPGYAHGFLVLTESADFSYKCTDYYAPAQERTLFWNDPALGITWPDVGPKLLSPKDEKGLLLSAAETFA